MILIAHIRVWDYPEMGLTVQAAYFIESGLHEVPIPRPEILVQPCPYGIGQTIGGKKKPAFSYADCWYEKKLKDLPLIGKFKS